MHSCCVLGKVILQGAWVGTELAVEYRVWLGVGRGGNSRRKQPKGLEGEEEKAGVKDPTKDRWAQEAPFPETGSCR